MLVQKQHVQADGIIYSLANRSLLGANTDYPTNPDVRAFVCGSLLPASVLQAPTQLWLEEGPDLGAGLAAPLSAGLPGVQAAGKDVRARCAPLCSKMLGALLATSRAFVAE